MAKKLAKGQVTITTLDDGYHIGQSVGEYVFPASSNGTIISAVTVVSTVRVTRGNTNFTSFTIGPISKPAGFSNITVDNANKTVTYSVAANTSSLAEHGSLTVPVLIGGMTYNLSFQWAKAKNGATGGNGKDGYTVKSSRQGCTVSTDGNGRIHTAVTVSTVISALRGTTAITPVIGALPIVPGCSLTKSGTTVTIVFNAGTSLAEQGVIDLPVTVDGIAFSMPFSYAKARAGATGAPGVDANLLDWVSDWNTNKTLINNATVITPKIFAGVKNSDGTLTGMAIGRFALSVKNASGGITGETVDGIYGFRNGIKTFFIDNGGNTQLGLGTQFIKYNAVSGKVEFGPGVSLNWIGATYIDKDGIFTGTLSANAVNSLRLNASQIVAGTIAANRIDVNALKASLITTGNIEALTLNVTKGKIGGWAIDGDSICCGTKNNTGSNFTSASGAVTLGSNGLRGFKWRLDATGAGALAGGNIAWDASGNVTFGASVTVQWTASVNSITAALGGTSYPKLTKITAAGIYTGTITASQITAGTISSDRIAAGSINASKLDAASIKTSIVNTDYINGLSCTFNKGKIGGWTIGADTISTGSIGSIGAMPVQIRSSATGSGYWYSGAYKPYGICMTWYQSNNAGHIVFGQVAGSGNTVKSGFLGIQMMSWDHLEYFCLSANYTRTGSKEIYNRIAGWAFDHNHIWKNNVALGADGSLANGTKWKLNNDGSGQIAGGNISWNTAGTVSFSQAVSLNWKNDIEAAKTANFGYRYYKKIIIGGESGKYYPVVIKGGDQTIKRDILVRRNYNEQAPSDWDNKSATHMGGLILLLKSNFGGWGGAAYSWDIYELSEMYSRMFGGAVHCGNSCMFAVYLRGGGTTGAVYHIYSDQPVEGNLYSPPPVPASPQTAYNSDLIFQSGDTKAYAPAPRTLTAAVEDEIRRHRFIALSQANDSTLTAHPLTYIGSTGIYTGTLTANQITAGTISSDRIAAGSINASKLDAASLKANIINTSYINGLDCVFTRGTIGGWTIDKTTLSSGQIVLDKANKRISVFGAASTATSGHRVQLYYNSNTDFGLYATNTDGVIVAQIGSLNRIAGWQFNTNQIYKNNIYLGSDGSIYNGAKWRLNSDGSGRIANGNISWDASGVVTFASSVSLQWRTGITTSQELASAMAFGRMLYRDPTFFNGNNSTGTYNNSGNGMVVITRIKDDNAPNDSKYVLKIQTNGAAAPANGGFYFSTGTSYRKVLIARIIAKIPVGHCIQWASNSIGSGGTSRWLTSNTGTGDWKEYVYKVVCGTSNFSSTHYYYIDGTQGSSSAPLIWYVAYATVFDLTSSEKYTTTIDSNGIYTASLNAGQITAGTISADRIAAGSINSSKLDAASIKANIINTSYINGLSCTFVRGSIGGWNINSSQIYKNSVVLASDGSITNGNKWRLNNDGSGKLANGNITWDAAGNVQAKNAIFTNVRVNGSVRNKFVLNDSSIWIGGNTSQQENLVNYDNIVAVRGGWDENIALPWTLDNSGRRVTLVNYKWGSNTTVGYMSISAPSGKYFFEDGLSKTSISFSRELIELLGYGDNSTFFGWIVVNRRDLVTTKRYGQFVQVMCQGYVSNGSIVKQKCYEGSKCTCSRIGTGQYRVYMPYSFSSTNDYTVHLTGVATNGANTFACLRAKYGSYFDVWTADDASSNDGGFTFWVVSMGDWT